MSDERVGSFSWQVMGAPYQVFSALCDPGDWEKILAATAEAIALNSGPHLRVLDVGSGTGLSAERIRRHLLGTHGASSEWMLVEPDRVAQEMEHLLMPPGGDCLPVNYATHIPDDRVYDVVLLLHSSYYLADLDDRVRVWSRDVLSRGGIVVCVAMCSASPFYIDAVNNRTTGAAEAFERLCTSHGLVTESCALLSRFRWNGELLQDEKLRRQITRFVSGRDAITSSDIAAVTRALGDREIDFQDRLIVARRPW